MRPESVSILVDDHVGCILIVAECTHGHEIRNQECVNGRKEEERK